MPGVYKHWSSGRGSEKERGGAVELLEKYLEVCAHESDSFCLHFCESESQWVGKGKSAVEFSYHVFLLQCSNA